MNKFSAHIAKHIKKSSQDIFKNETGLHDWDALVGNDEQGPHGYKTLKDYYREYKGITGEIVNMSPNEYLSKITWGPIHDKSMESLRDAVAAGSKINMPWLEYRDGHLVSQEGRHRATLAKEMGITTIPVLIINQR